VISALIGCTDVWSLDNTRARYNYMLFCQGCHLPDGRGSEGHVPGLKGFVGHFLGVEGGREFLVQVPGSANSTIDAVQLAELLNWIVLEFADDSMPDNFSPYTEAEVASLRKNPLIDIEHVRADLIKKIKRVSVD